MDGWIDEWMDGWIAYLTIIIESACSLKRSKEMPGKCCSISLLFLKYKISYDKHLEEIEKAQFPSYLRTTNEASV